MGFAVMHISKGAGAGGGSGKHIDRIENPEMDMQKEKQLEANEKGRRQSSFVHADKSSRYLNRNFEVANNRHQMPLPKAINDRIKEGYNGKRKIRSDAKKYLQVILTGSNKEMNEIFKNDQKADDWIKANKAFIENKFGKDNLVRFSLHMDEKTPHIHAVVVPLTKDGRLSAKEVMGNKTKLQAYQDRYAAAMDKFGLERGLRSTGIKHESAKDYYKRINTKPKDKIEMRHFKQGFLGSTSIDKDATIKSQDKALKSAYGERNKAYEREHVAKNSANKSAERAREAETEVGQLKERIAEISLNPEEAEKEEKRIAERFEPKMMKTIKEETRKFPEVAKMSPNQLIEKAKEIINKVLKMLDRYPNLKKRFSNDKSFHDKAHKAVQEQAREMKPKRRMRR